MKHKKGGNKGKHGAGKKGKHHESHQGGQSSQVGWLGRSWRGVHARDRAPCVHAPLPHTLCGLGGVCNPMRRAAVELAA